jgi:3-isopropylmalate/(R)-2-methylmalate dehydratase large subunit
MKPRTLYDKIWDDHVIARLEDGTCLIGIDRHLLHEVTSPQAFEGLRASGRSLRHPELTLAVPDHNVPTIKPRYPVTDPQSAIQLRVLEQNCLASGIEHIGMTESAQGIVHVVGPEQAFTLPGLTLVCGDSHSSTHGALGALAFGIGTSEIETVLATQALLMRKSRNMLVRVEGHLGLGVGAKDLALYLIGMIGAAGGTGYVLEFSGRAIGEMSVEARMTLCNMAIEAGARTGLIAPDEKTFAYLSGRRRAPKGEAWRMAVSSWKQLYTDAGARFDRVVSIQADDVAPMVSWGTSSEDVVPITGYVPAIDTDPSRAAATLNALDYMGLKAGMPVTEIMIDQVFIGSCTNGRIEDLRAAAALLRGRKIAPSIKRAIVVPGSGLVKQEAESEGLQITFLEAGFEWREPGCSMCLGMNADKVPEGQRCASTSNRNFEGRQGVRARTHLMSPPMAAAAAVAGHLVDVRTMGRS